MVMPTITVTFLSYVFMKWFLLLHIFNIVLDSRINIYDNNSIPRSSQQYLTMIMLLFHILIASERQRLIDWWIGFNVIFAHRGHIQYIPRNIHTVTALQCFVVVIHWLIFPYPSGLLHWHCGNLTIAPVPAKQPWWIWINTSCEFIMNDCITTTKQSTTKPCAYFLGYTVGQPPTTLTHNWRI